MDQSHEEPSFLPRDESGTEAEFRPMIDQAALEAAYKRGIAEGKHAAINEAEAMLKNQELEFQLSVNSLFGAMTEAQQQFLQKSEESVLKLALQIAERIIKYQITLDNEIVVEQAKMAVKRIIGIERVKLLVNPADEAILKKYRKAVHEASDAIKEVLIEADEKIEQGGCVIESDAGNIDARISTQLAKIQEALLGGSGTS